MQASGRQALSCCQFEQLLQPSHALEASWLLESVSHARPRAFGDRSVRDILPFEDDFAARGLFDAHDQLGKRGFTAAVRPGDNHELIGIDGKRDTIDDAFQFLSNLPQGEPRKRYLVIQARLLLKAIVRSSHCFYLKLSPFRFPDVQVSQVWNYYHFRQELRKSRESRDVLHLFTSGERSFLSYTFTWLIKAIQEIRK